MAAILIGTAIRCNCWARRLEILNFASNLNYWSKIRPRSHQEPGAEFAWNPRRQAQIGAITSCFCLVIGTETSRGTGGKNLGAGPAATSSPE
jgi:hypothetical protein